ncbi:MAG: hypothetical protein KDD66_11170 [Bdellovibrionales bacterium]|nr:hypothetical protein [Bdellovibrionales bacterium]
MFRMMRFIFGGVAKVLLIIWVGVFVADHGEQIPEIASAFAKSAAESIPQGTAESMRHATDRTFLLVKSGFSEIAEIYYESQE